MELRKLFTDARAASPVVGVILMVAVTIVLGSVLGSSLLGVSQRVEETPPHAQFVFDYGQNLVDDDDESGNDGISIEFDTGDEIERDQLRVLVDGRNLLDRDGSINESIDGLVSAGVGDAEQPAAGVLTAGDTYVFVEDTDVTDSLIQHGDSVRVVWEGGEGTKTATIAKSQVYF